MKRSLIISIIAALTYISICLLMDKVLNVKSFIIYAVVFYNIGFIFGKIND